MKTNKKPQSALVKLSKLDSGQKIIAKSKFDQGKVIQSKFNQSTKKI